MARNAFFYLSNLLTRIVVSFRGYITGDTQDAADRTEFLEPLQADRGAEIDRNQTTVQNENGELPPDRSNSGTSIYLSSNAGTVIIGNNTVFRLSNIETAGCETEKNDEVAPSLRNSKPTLKEEPPITNIDEKNTRRRSRKPKTASLKPPAVVRRFKEIQKTLSKYRGDGKWSEHAKAVKCFENEYKRDKDNLDIMLLLMYEKAVAYYEKNEIGMARTLAHKIKGELDTARKMVTKVSREISVQYKETNWQQIDDNKKIIYCKCLFLVSRIYCVKGRFEKARKAVDFANQILSRHLNNVELKANLYLAYAQVYQVCFNRVHCTSKGVTQVFSYLDKSEAISRNLKKPDPEKWEEIRREILLLRSLAIVQFYLHDGNKLEFVNVLDGSLEELEHHLWDGILLKQKVEFYVLKSDYFKVHGQLVKALDYAKQALDTAQQCECKDVVSQLNDRIGALKNYPEDPVNNSEGLVKKVLGIQTTTDGNVESNAADISDRGIFSTDESDSDILGFTEHAEREYFSIRT